MQLRELPRWGTKGTPQEISSFENQKSAQNCAVWTNNWYSVPEILSQPGVHVSSVTTRHTFGVPKLYQNAMFSSSESYF
jgi:hypothetical protein